MIGTVLKHRFEVIEKIGEGNLFTVYKCDDKINNHIVAAKVLHPHYASNTMFAERILVEAQALIGVSHPGLVEVYDSGEQDGHYFVVTEYVRGVDLQERIRRTSQLTLTSAVDTAMAICEALDFVHSKGFVHGDLRPGNILVTPEGQLKIMDLWVSGAIASSPSIRTSALLRSVHYMAPEVAEGQPASPSSDIYSLGIMLFQLLTGSLPFDADTPIAIAVKHAREPVPDIRELNPAVPKNLVATIMKALQKSPELRFRSAKAMLGELKSVNDALRLSGPLVWSQPTETKAPKTVAHQEEEYEDEPESPFFSAVRKTLLAVVIFLAVVVVLSAVYMWTKPGDVRLPNLIGKNMDEAHSLLGNRNIELIVKNEQYNEEYPEGAIYFMNPEPGRTIKTGKAIEVWISKGSKYSRAPNIVNMSQEEAEMRIVDAGLNVGERSQEYSETVPAGNIIKQSPSGGAKLDRGAPLNIVMSLGPKPSEEPMYPEETAQSDQVRSFDVELTVPDGPQEQKVQITVHDDRGENVVYQEVARPGDTIKQTVQGIGRRITIRTYIDDKLVSEEPK